jgi:hypothetical protein
VVHSLSRIVIAIVFIFCLAPIALAEFNWKNIKCACVGSKTPSQKDYQAIRLLFPEAEKIQRLVFKEKTYYILVKNRKISCVLSGWETGVANQHLWLVLNKSGQCVESVRLPLQERIDLKSDKLFVNAELPQHTGDYFEAIQLLHADLNLDWEQLIKRVRLNIYKSDAISQATP